MKEFGFVVEYGPGSLADLLQLLAEEHVNVEAIAGIESDGTGLIRLIPDSPQKAAAVLRGLGIAYEEREALVIDLPNHPGELAALLDRLGKDGVDLLSCYAGVERNRLFLTAAQLEQAKRILHLT